MSYEGGLHEWYAQLFGGIKRSRHQNVLVIRESSGGGHGKNGKKGLLQHLFPVSDGAGQINSDAWTSQERDQCVFV